MFNIDQQHFDLFIHPVDKEDIKSGWTQAKNNQWFAKMLRIALKRLEAGPSAKPKQRRNGRRK